MSAKRVVHLFEPLAEDIGAVYKPSLASLLEVGMPPWRQSGNWKAIMKTLFAHEKVDDERRCCKEKIWQTEVFTLAE